MSDTDNKQDWRKLMQSVITPYSSLNENLSIGIITFFLLILVGIVMGFAI